MDTSKLHCHDDWLSVSMMLTEIRSGRLPFCVCFYCIWSDCNEIVVTLTTFLFQCMTSTFSRWHPLIITLKRRVVMMLTLSSVAVLEVVITTTSCTANDNKVGIMKTISPSVHYKSTPQKKWRLVMMPTLSSVAVLEVVITTTSSTANDNKVGIMKTISPTTSLWANESS